MFRTILAASLLLLVAGCATLQNRDRLRDETLEHYGASLRWSGFETAWDFVDPAVREARPLTPQQKARYAAVRVAGYDASGPRATGDDTIAQTAQVSLIVKASQQVYSVVDHQRWRWDPQAKRWWLETGLPDITPQP